MINDTINSCIGRPHAGSRRVVGPSTGRRPSSPTRRRRRVRSGHLSQIFAPSFEGASFVWLKMNGWDPRSPGLPRTPIQLIRTQTVYYNGGLVSSPQTLVRTGSALCIASMKNPMLVDPRSPPCVGALPRTPVPASPGIPGAYAQLQAEFDPRSPSLAFRRTPILDAKTASRRVLPGYSPPVSVSHLPIKYTSSSSPVGSIPDLDTESTPQKPPSSLSQDNVEEEGDVVSSPAVVATRLPFAVFSPQGEHSPSMRRTGLSPLRTPLSPRTTTPQNAQTVGVADVKLDVKADPKPLSSHRRGAAGSPLGRILTPRTPRTPLTPQQQLSSPRSVVSRPRASPLAIR